MALVPDPSSPLHALMTTHRAPGRVEWIGVREARRGTVRALDRATIGMNGLAGDHRARPGKRAVTLIQFEHLPVIAALAGVEGTLAPERLRRNIVVSGINLLALRDGEIRVGTAVLRAAGICAPCSRMTEEFGPGGYNAVRGHGGLIGEVIEPGEVALGDAVSPIGIVAGVAAAPR